MFGRVVLDLAAFKALASESRIEILKALDERQKTITELARQFDLSKAAVHEHLNVLVECGLVDRLDAEERKWVYYRLTWKGTGLVNPGKKKVAFFLALSSTFFVVGFVYLLARLKDLVDRARMFNGVTNGDGLGVQGANVTSVATFWDLATAALVLGTAAVVLTLAVVEFKRSRPLDWPKPDPDPPGGRFDASEEEPQ